MKNTPPPTAPPVDMNGRLAFTVDEAARITGMSRASMHNLVMAGEIPSTKLGRLRRIPADALKARLGQVAS